MLSMTGRAGLTGSAAWPRRELAAEIHAAAGNEGGVAHFIVAVLVADLVGCPLDDTLADRFLTPSRIDGVDPGESSHSRYTRAFDHRDPWAQSLSGKVFGGCGRIGRIGVRRRFAHEIERHVGLAAPGAAARP